MSLAAGTRLGPYEIVALLGVGGMGEVYKARDPRLGRDVAIKVLPESVAADPARLHRFEQEARAVAALSHPNIVAIFDVGTGDRPYLVTELLEGETLRAVLDRGPLSLKRATEVALQLVAGLTAAHDRSVVHRDLKPENIFLTRDHGVKILDFGLAKAISPPEAGLHDVDVTRASATMAGLVMGTAGYMSPEQVRGQAADPRSDIFATGAILYEMVTGQRAFQGASPADTMSAVLREQPMDLVLRSGTPPALARLVRRCLEKDPKDRFQTARDLKFAIESISDAHPAAPPAKTSDEKSIAVLPFEDLSPDRSQQPFCEGMAAEIINALGAVPGLRVISRISAARCREKGLDIPEIGAHLNVTTVLEGTVRKSGERLRISAQLVNTRDGGQIWATRYDRNEGDIFDIQDDIAAAIVDNLKVQLAASGPAPSVKRYTDNLEAYNLYLKGRYYWERRNDHFLTLALQHFERAIAADPDYALAHAGVADCHTLAGLFGFRRGTDEHALAEAAARRALELDPTLAEAHLAMASLHYWNEWEWAKAEAGFRKAIALNPRLAIAHIYYASLLAVLRRTEEALQEVSLAIACEPDSALISNISGTQCYWLRRLDLARANHDRGIELDPEILFGYAIRSATLCEGQLELALADAEHGVSASHRQPYFLKSLGYAYARVGRRADAERVIEELHARSEREYIAPLHIADVYAGLGEAAQTCDWLERAYEHRNGFLVGLSVSPAYDLVRDDPRFQALVARMHLR
jgi:serine/threonine-protein kinase